MSSSPLSSRLLEFTGRGCSHCIRMVPVVAEVERDTGKTIHQLEVWYDEKNEELMRQHADAIRNVCGGFLGVPAFYNEATGEALCGEQEKDDLLRWAQDGQG